MDRNLLFTEYTTGKVMPYEAIKNDILKRFEKPTVSVEEINERLAELALCDDEEIKGELRAGYSVDIIREVLAKPIRQITDKAERERRRNLSQKAREYMAHHTANAANMLKSTDGLNRDVTNIISYNASPEEKSRRVAILKGDDVAAKKQLFMTILNEFDTKLSKLDLSANFTDKEIVDNLSTLDITNHAIVLHDATKIFQKQYKVEFTKEELVKIQIVDQKGQDANMSFLNRVGTIGNPYYETVNPLDFERLGSLCQNESDILNFRNDPVAKHFMSSAISYYTARRKNAISCQAEAFANKHNININTVNYQVTLKDGTTILLDNAHSSGISHAKSIIMTTPDKAYSADVSLNFNDSLAAYEIGAVDDLALGSLEGKDFVKECGDLFTAMNSVDHWYQNSSPEFRDTKKLLKSIANSKPMSRETAGEKSAELVSLADKYIKDHLGKPLNAREQARMDVMTKISRTFNAKHVAIENARKKAEELHSNNRFTSEENREAIDKQIDAERNYERAPHALQDVTEEEIKGPATEEEVSALNKKLNAVTFADISYSSKKIVNDLGNNNAQYFVLKGAMETGNLVSYARGESDNLPKDFDPSDAMAYNIINTMLKAEREANNPGYLKNAKSNTPIQITAGPFEKLLANTNRHDIVNTIKKTATMQNFCKNISPEKVGDLLANHKEIKLGQSIKLERTQNNINKSVSFEAGMRREEQAKKAPSMGF